MSEEKINDMIEPIPNWEYTYRYDSPRTCGKSYFQSLLDEKQQKIDKALDMLDLIIPELWNISNAMTYKIKEVRRILGDKENE